MVRKRKTTYTIRSVSHALDILEEFHGDVAELGVTDLSRRLKLTKNNVFRLLATLESRDYIVQNRETENYRLGLKTLELGQVLVRQMGRLISNSRGIMEAMARECNETLCLSILHDFYTVNLDSIECNQPLRVVPRIGVRLPAYCTAAGKVHIAHLLEEKLNSYVSGCQLVRYTPHTITDPEQLRSQLHQVARQGYAVDLEELDMGVRCVGAPIRDYTSKIIGAVTFSGPAQRFDDELMRNKLIPLVKKGAADISANLGYS